MVEKQHNPDVKHLDYSVFLSQIYSSRCSSSSALKNTPIYKYLVPVNFLSTPSMEWTNPTYFHQDGTRITQLNLIHAEATSGVTIQHNSVCSSLL